MNDITFRSGSYPEKIFNLGQSTFESKTNSEIAELVGCSNEGQIANARKSVSEKTGWKMLGREATATATPKTRKSGSLPAKIEGFLVGMVDEVPETWTPEHVIPIVQADEVSWNRFIRRMNDLDSEMIISFERWLGHGATMSRHNAYLDRQEAEKEEQRISKIKALAADILELGPEFQDMTIMELVKHTSSEPI